MHEPSYTWQDFKEVLGDPKPYYNRKGKDEKTALSLKSRIAAVRRRKKKKAFEIKQEVSELILNDMLQRGRFYKTRDQLCYYFDEDKKSLYLIGDDRALGAKIEEEYGINPSEQEYDYLTERMTTEALIRGELTTVHQFAHYDNDANILYVYNNDNGIYRLDGQDIKLVSNGAEGKRWLSASS